MPRQNQSCPRCRPPAPEPPRAAAPVLEEEMRIRRHVHPIPIPAPANPGWSEALCLLRRQNELLCEIVSLLRADADGT